MFHAGSCAGFDFDGSFGDVEFVGEKFEERGVRFAVMRAGAEIRDEAFIFELF